MAELLRMPEIATGTDEATLVSWPIEVAAEFTESDVIAVVETAKAVVDVEAGRAGVLVRTLVEPGTDVKVGAPIALIAGVGETLGEVDEVLRSLSSDAPAEPAPVPALAAPALAAPPADLARIFASPLARRMAREGGLALADLTGTGLGGRIVRRDVERALASKSAPASAPAPAPAAASVEPAADLPEGATAVPHTRLRRLIATRLTESKRTIPHFALRASIEVDDLLALRARINEVSDVKVSVNDLVIKAVAAAHLAVPDANVIWTDEAMVRFAGVDIAVAIAAPAGLVTPVIRGVERLSLTALARTVRDLVERAGSGQLRQAELEGGSTTVTNLGRFGTEEFTAIINPPHSSILSVGAIAKRPVVLDSGEITARSTMNVVLSVDHRAIDGVLAAEWMRALTQAFRTPLTLLV